MCCQCCRFLFSLHLQHTILQPASLSSAIPHIYSYESSCIQTFSCVISSFCQSFPYFISLFSFLHYILFCFMCTVLPCKFFSLDFCALNILFLALSACSVSTLFVIAAFLYGIIKSYFFPLNSPPQFKQLSSSNHVWSNHLL